MVREKPHDKTQEAQKKKLTEKSRGASAAGQKGKRKGHQTRGPEMARRSRKITPESRGMPGYPKRKIHQRGKRRMTARSPRKCNRRRRELWKRGTRQKGSKRSIFG